MNGADALGIATVLLPQVPFALVAAAGLCYAVATRRRHPRVSLLAAVAFACLAASIAIRAGIQLVLVGGRPASALELATQLAIWNSFAAGLLLVSLILLAVAAFLPR